ncbi:hypothetical protein [Streptomyces syringium]|uniref:hypothetical protein n=1 Tax=Streptomyces syringium TaxID=76729 RepID=UPI0037CF150D
MNTTTVVHALTCTACGGHDVRYAARRRAACNDCGKEIMIAEAMRCDCWGYECVPAVVRKPAFAPGGEHLFSISDIAHATAQLLGRAWTAESGLWGARGAVYGPYCASFEFAVDNEGDFIIEYEAHFVDDAFPEYPTLPEGVKDYIGGVYIELASEFDGLESLATKAAAAIRAASGYDPDDFDFTSSASRQHHIDTGRYLRKGEAEEV